ncbi:snRNP assembly factor [Arthroderma uncinatum]|uniref:snRNP assembly factor n=1 Tax=Arthroderma uncinatum TaxID=74035 RepID=UPI00144ADA5E|nr:snRNP assembly factor [Arthroderma uncinatum]KAF3481652.1 snRNP assembly factor [Arthroderma uncinatum]
MAKRPAEDSPGEPIEVGSPAAKRPKIYSTDQTPESIDQPRDLADRTEQRWASDERKRNDISAPTDEEEKETEEAELSDVEENDNRHRTIRQNAPLEGYDDLYLDTIQRAALDFDFEKLCSVSLSNINVYACLVCGKYYQGRGHKSHAYFHALEVGHHVFVNMETKKVYVLPEGYEVKNKSLDDIKYVVDPYFSKEEVAKLDKVVIDAFDLSGKRYRPGFVGMNNIKSNDYLNVIVQLLAHVRPIRNFFLLHDFPALSTPQLPLRFGMLVRKLWNPRAFKAHVSPHELLQEVAIRSSKRFTLTKQSDPIEFLSWFLNNLHLTLGGSKKPSSKPTSVIQSAFHGKLRIESQAITARSDSANARLVFSESSTTTSQVNPFLMLTLDLPPTPLFQSSNKDSIIPQVPLTSLLSKYNGITASEKLSHRVRHRLLHPLPPYLLFHIKRFSKNKFVAERNPTIVTFPSPHGLDMSPYVEPDPSVWPPGEPIIYDLVANVILDAAVTAPGGPENAANSAETSKELSELGPSAPSASTTPGAAAGNHKVSWLIQLHDKAMATENAQQQQHKGPEWLEAQDLWVKRTESETLFTREGYLMVWERRKTKPPGANK